MMPILISGTLACDLTLGRNYSDTIYSLVLAANTEQHFTIPAKAGKVFINIQKVNTVSYWTKIGGTGTTAAIPVANVLDGTASSLNVPFYSLRPTDTTISVICDGATIMTFAFYL
jgi:hypothetical protein